MFGRLGHINYAMFKGSSIILSIPKWSPFIELHICVCIAWSMFVKITAVGAAFVAACLLWLLQQSERLCYERLYNTNVDAAMNVDI